MYEKGIWFLFSSNILNLGLISACILNVNQIQSEICLCPKYSIKWIKQVQCFCRKWMPINLQSTPMFILTFIRELKCVLWTSNDCVNTAYLLRPRINVSNIFCTAVCSSLIGFHSQVIHRPSGQHVDTDFLFFSCDVTQLICNQLLSAISIQFCDNFFLIISWCLTRKQYKRCIGQHFVALEAAQDERNKIKSLLNGNRLPYVLSERMRTSDGGRCTHRNPLSLDRTE